MKTLALVRVPSSACSALKSNENKHKKLNNLFDGIRKWQKFHLNKIRGCENYVWYSENVNLTMEEFPIKWELTSRAIKSTYGANT